MADTFASTVPFEACTHPNFTASVGVRPLAPDGTTVVTLDVTCAHCRAPVTVTGLTAAKPGEATLTAKIEPPAVP